MPSHTLAYAARAAAPPGGAARGVAVQPARRGCSCVGIDAPHSDARGPGAAGGSAPLLRSGHAPRCPCSIYFSREGSSGWTVEQTLRWYLLLTPHAVSSVVGRVFVGAVFCSVVCGVVVVWLFSWVWRNMCFQVLPKPGGCCCFGGKDNVRLLFLIFNGMFQGRISTRFPQCLVQTFTPLQALKCEFCFFAGL